MMMQGTPKKLLGICAGLLLSAGVQAEEPESYIKYREKAMDAASAHMGASAQIIQDKVGLKAHLPIHAAALQGLLSDIPALFPPESDFGETDAKEEVWSKRAEFEEASTAAKSAAEAFAQAVTAGNQEVIGKSFEDLGASCKGCHKEFKAKR